MSNNTPNVYQIAYPWHKQIFLVRQEPWVYILTIGNKIVSTCKGQNPIKGRFDILTSDCLNNAWNILPQSQIASNNKGSNNSRTK